MIVLSHCYYYYYCECLVFTHLEQMIDITVSACNAALHKL